MSFAVSRTAIAAGGARAAPRASAKARVPCALATRTPSVASFRATHLRGSHTPPLRAAEDDESPAPAPAPEELSFPELSDDEEVKGAQITAIITGAFRTRTDRSFGRLPVVIPLGPTWRASGAREREILTIRRPPSISTGIVSVALAVGYLALVQVIDSREMLPPPPEAMGMGECPPGERRC